MPVAEPDMHVNSVQGGYVVLDGESYYEIRNSHLMPEFFMSIVGADDHWMFVSSKGALSAGRQNPDGALFPYLSDDRISATRHQTGPVTVIRLLSADLDSDGVWTPFAEDDLGVERSLYKTPMGNKVIFEERHLATGLVFRYRWTFSARFGFIRDCWLENGHHMPVRLSVLDGVQNLLPCGVGSDFWMRFSNLGNAYKKSELVPDSNLGLYYLSSIPTDRAEPSEGLRATIAWHVGFDPDAVLLTPAQVDAFTQGHGVTQENDVRGKSSSFLATTEFELAANESTHWRQIIDTEKDQTDVIDLMHWLSSEADVMAAIDADIADGETQLRRLIASSDGLQCGSNLNRINRHFSNTLFNVMRGGVPLENYEADTHDFVAHVAHFNARVAESHANTLAALPPKLGHDELTERLKNTADADLMRLGLEYLPLAFSRRHGDPTRPWNRFSIDLRSADGGNNLNYQGNWRDIFQNWEALGMAFPEFFPAMICRFLNATTADGYNAYRITKDGLEWEEPEPEDPWSNIGYWCDHQIIYLLKLMEWHRAFHPESSRSLLSDAVFVHAEVPYRIGDFERIKRDPRETIDFDWKLAKEIEHRVDALGSDGKLLRNQSGEIHHVTMLEKLLTLSLAKLSNFVPDGGIWLNTQRPEWNDANNALVGNGLSMVTTSYLHRWFAFLSSFVAEDAAGSYAVSEEVSAFMRRTASVMSEHESDMATGFSSASRAAMVEALSWAGSDYRNSLYDDGPSGRTTNVTSAELHEFFQLARRIMESTIKTNRRSDGLYHSYNLLDWKQDGLDVSTLYEMLEGQVAVLSSGLLDAEEADALLKSLRASALYRDDQDSYLLYPNRTLPDFLTKNRLEERSVVQHPLLVALLEAGDNRIIKRDARGGYHFNGQFRNGADLKSALESLESPFAELAAEGGQGVVNLFEDIFNHRMFTGRSGTFFAYEGLGSIYWHMVSKLALAVSENASAAQDTGASESVVASLYRHLESIRNGIGAEKSPEAYGAFPTDPYSHTPEGAGVKQPGMTGQVKEDVLARYSELGVEIQDGVLSFGIDAFDPSECLDEGAVFSYFDVQGQEQRVDVPAGGFAFTMCQVPVIYTPGENGITVTYSDGERASLSGHTLPRESSQDVFKRTGHIQSITCTWSALNA